MTGGCGFIGSNFISYWLDRHPNDFIINLDALTYAGTLYNTYAFQKNPHYKFVKGNICNTRLVDKLARDVDTIVHFAAESHVDRSIVNPAVFIETNVNGTNTLLKAALKNKVKRFHHISTDEVFGHLQLDSTDKFSETTPYNPRSPYAASKAASDHLVRAYYYTFGLNITITNCSNNYGPNQKPESFIPRAITNLLTGQPIPIYGSGKYIRDWIHVEDHCQAIEKVLFDGQIGETYIVGGSDQDITNLAVAKFICKLMNRDESNIAFVSDRLGHDQKYAVDWQKINTQLGWSPKHTLKESLPKTIEWYTQHQEFWQKSKKGFEQFYQDLVAAAGIEPATSAM